MIHSHVFRKYSRYVAGLCCLFFIQNNALSQVVTNNGAVISIKQNTVIQTKDAENSGSIENKGSVQVSGNWNNNGIFSDDAGNILFNGSNNQFILKTGGESFFNFELKNNADSVQLKNALQVHGKANFEKGQLNTGYDIDFLGEVLCGLGKINAWWGTVSYPVWADHIIEGTYYNLTLKGNSVKTLCGNVRVLNKLTIEAGTLEIGPYNLIVDGVTEISGTIADGNINGTNIFRRQVIMNTSSFWNFSGNGDVEFQNGLEYNGAGFNSGTGTYRFTTNNQSIDGANPLTFNAKVIIGSDIALTNTITAAGTGLTLKSELDGTNSTSVYRNIGITSYEYSNAPMSSGRLDATNADNIFRYSGGMQTITAGATDGNYYHLVIAGSNTKTFNGNLHIEGDLKVENNTTLAFGGSSAYTMEVMGDFDASAGNLNMSLGITKNHILKLYGFNNSCANLSTDDQSIIEYLGGDNQQVFASGNYRNISFGGTGHKVFAGNVTASGNILNISTNVNPAGYELYLTDPVVNINRTSGSVTGKVKRNLNQTSVNYLFPVGTDTSYNSLSVNYTNIVQGDYLVEFVSGDIGNSGLPLDDDGIEIYDRFTNGYWKTQALNGLASNKYNLELNTEGFGTDLSSRIMKKETGALFVNGKHNLLSGTIISRIELDEIFSSQTIFAIGKGRPIVVVHPVNDTVCDGSNAFFKIKATGHKPLAYKWYKAGTPDIALSDNAKYNGTSTDNLTILNAHEADQAGFYCMVSDAAGHFVKSNNAFLIVNKIPVVILSRTRDTICNNTIATIDIAPEQKDTIYNWYIIADANVTGANAGSGIQIKQTLTNENLFPAKVIYAIQGTGPKPTFCQSDIVFDTIWINPTPQIAVATSHDTLCYNEGVQIDVSSLITATKTIKYHLEIETDGGISNYTSPGDYALGTFSDNLINNTADTQHITYIFKPYIENITGSLSCENGEEVRRLIKINPRPQIDIHSTADTVVCFNEGITFNVDKLNPSHIGNWVYDVTTVVSSTGVTGFTSSAFDLTGNFTQLALANNSDTLQWIDYTFKPRIFNPRNNLINCNDGVSKSIRVFINPKPQIAAYVSDDTICYNETVNFNLSHPNTSIKGIWKYHLTTSTSSPLVTGYTVSTNDLSTMSFSNTLLNTSKNWQTVTYHFVSVLKDPRTGKDYCADGKDTTIIIVINPRPEIKVSYEDTLCYNEGTNFSIIKPNQVVGDWVYDVNISASDASVSGYSNQTDATNLSFSENIVNHSNTLQWLDYIITPKIKNPTTGVVYCNSGIDTSFRIYINPKPLLTANTDSVICSEDLVHFNISSGNATILKEKYMEISTQYNAAAISGVKANGHYALSDFTDQLFNNSDVVQMVEYRIKAEFKDPRSNKLFCTNGTDTIIKVFVNPIPKVKIIPHQDTICNETATSLTITTVSQTKDGIRFRYTSEAINGGTIIGLKTNIEGLNTGFKITDTLINNTPDAQLVQFIITPYILDIDGNEKCTNGKNDTAYVWVEPTPVITANLDTICNNGITDIIVKSNNTLTRHVRYTYTAAAENIGAVNGIVEISGRPLTTHITDQLTNITNVSQKVIYTITPWVYDSRNQLRCSGSPININVWVEPSVNITVIGDTLCDSTFTKILPVSAQSTLNGIRYTWQINSDPQITGATISAGDGFMLGNTIVQQLFNNSNAAKRVTYTITPHLIDINGNNACSFSSKSIDVWVNPTAKIFANIPEVLYCDSATVNFNIQSLNGTVIGEKYYKVTTSYNSALIKPDQLIDGDYPIGIRPHKLINLTTAPQQITYNVKAYIRNPKGNNPSETCLQGYDTTITLEVLPVLKADLTPSIYAGNWNIKCKGNNNGSISLALSGGMRTKGMSESAAAYYWNNALSTKNRTNLKAGAYNVYVTDIKGCKAWNSIQLKEPEKLSVNPIVTTEGNCSSVAKGEIISIGTGGTRPYSIIWNDGSSEIGYDTLIQNLTYGEYHVSYTDANACKFDTSTIFEVSGSIAINIAASKYTGDSITFYGVSCPGFTNGYINATIQTASDSLIYTFKWFIKTEEGNTLLQEATTNNSLNAGLLKDRGPGKYLIEVSNNAGCKGQTEYIVTEPPKVNISAILSKGLTNDYELTCDNTKDGSIKTIVTGGYNKYKYSWISSTPLTNDSVSEITDLDAGTYILNVDDNWQQFSEHGSCHYSDTFVLRKPAPVILSHNLSNYENYNISCFNKEDGRISTLVQGGVSPFKYTWIKDSINLNLPDTTANLLKVGAGNYHLQLTYGSICNHSYDFSLTSPEPLKLDTQLSIFNGYNISCFNGKNGFIKTLISGGVAPYVYNWTKPDQQTSNAAEINNAIAGTYVFKATDKNQCAYIDHFELTQAPKIQTTLESTYINCNAINDGTANISSISGGVPPYQYIWSNGDASRQITRLPKGQYYAFVTDYNDCRDTALTTIVEPDPLIIKTKIISDYNGRNISCFGYRDGQIMAEVTGGRKPYNYKWLRMNQTTEIFNFQQNEVISGIPFGNYYVLVNDASNCHSTDSIVIVQPDSISISLDVIDVSCYNFADGKISTAIKGGTPPYSYFWNNNSTENSISNLDTGKYFLKIKDLNNCLANKHTIIKQPEILKVLANTMKPYCPATKNGSASLKIKGGLKPYKINWSNGSHEETLNNLPEDNYVFTVSDSNNCKFIDTVKLKAIHTACLDAPKAFSPNHDGVNDTWNILAGDPENYQLLSKLFPKATIEIYNRWGELVYRSEKGYFNEWNGTSKGKSLPMDSYYYSIDLGDGSEPTIGIISIVK